MMRNIKSLTKEPLDIQTIGLDILIRAWNPAMMGAPDGATLDAMVREAPLTNVVKCEGYVHRELSAKRKPLMPGVDIIVLTKEDDDITMSSGPYVGTLPGQKWALIQDTELRAVRLTASSFFKVVTC